MKFLVTVDGSSESEAILPRVLSLAKAAGADVTLLTVASPQEGEYPHRPEHSDLQIVGATADAGLAALEEPPSGEPLESHGQALARVRSTAEDYLAAIASRLRADGLNVERKVLVSEDAVQAITDTAQREGFDLIAMSTHGRSGLSSLVHGSIAGAVLRAAVAPVMLMRPQAG